MSAVLVAAERLSKAVRVHWQDGLAAQFSYVWLRDNSDRRPSLVHLDLDSRPADLQHSNNALRVLWPAYHESQYSSHFLRQHSTIRPRPVFPSFSSMIHLHDRVLPRPVMLMSRNAVDWQSAMGSIEWDGRAMDFGTIWPQMGTVPRTVAITPDDGASSATVYVVDAVEALEQFAEERPDLFRFLLETPIEYQDGLFRAAHPVAAIADGRVVSAVFNNTLRSSEMAASELETFYLSLKAFHAKCCLLATTKTIGRDLALLLDNTRMLLGAPPEHRRRLNISVFK